MRNIIIAALAAVGIGVGALVLPGGDLDKCVAEKYGETTYASGTVFETGEPVVINTWINSHYLVTVKNNEKTSILDLTTGEFVDKCE